MISRFMSSETPQPAEKKGPQREADVYDLLAWFELNKQKLLTAALILVALGFVIATMRYMRDQKELRASGELLALKASINPPTNTPPVQPSAFTKIAQDFSGTSAAERARLLAATANFTEAKYSEAEAAFKAFTSDFPNSEWRAAAAYGVAASQEAQNKPEAVASYQSVVTAHGKAAVADDARLALARIHEQKNQPADALRIYNEMLAPKPGAQPGTEMPNRTATERKDALLRAHPELNTNTAPTMPTAPMTLQPTLSAPSGSNGTLQIAPNAAPAATNNTK